MKFEVLSTDKSPDCSFLDGGAETELYKLPNQDRIAYTGINPRGPFDRPLDFLSSVPENERHAVFAYLNNHDVQQQAKPHARRVLIDVSEALANAGLGDAVPPVQERWLASALPYLYAELQRTVFAERAALPDSARNSKARSRPWIFEDARPGLRAAWQNLKTVVAIGNTGKHLRPSLLPRKCEQTHLTISPTSALYVVPSESRAVFALLSSKLFETQVRRSCSCLNSSLRFTPSEVFPYFPFPWKGQPTGNEYISPVLNPPAEVEARLGPFAEALLAIRENLLNSGEAQSPTDLYNAFDNPLDMRSGIEALREAHRRLESAVLTEYGWGDLASPERWIFDRPWIDGGVRYVPGPGIRREYLRRIEQLNHKQAALR